MVQDEHTSKFPLDSKGCEVMPFCVGSSVLVGSRGQLGTISKFASGVLSTKPGYASSIGGCTICFEAEGEAVYIDYTSLGTGKGGARLRRPPPTLRPPSRVPNGHQYSEALKGRVIQTFHSECATSPCGKDERSKRLAPYVHIKAQALIIMSDLRSIYSAHLRRFTEDVGHLSFAGFKTLKPWYAIKGDRETCLCKWCENFRCYQDALRVCAGYVEPLIEKSAAEEDAADEAHNDTASTDNANLANPANPANPADRPADPANPAIEPAAVQLQKLVRIAGLKSKQEIVNEFVCGSSIATARHDCVAGTCTQCGFRKMWSQGLRKSLIDSSGNLKPGIDKVWLTNIKYERLSSSKKPPANNINGEQSTPGTNQSPEKELMRQRCEGTIIELIDEFETKVMAKYPYHRKTLANQKLADQQAHAPPLSLTAPATPLPRAFVPRTQPPSSPRPGSLLRVVG